MSSRKGFEMAVGTLVVMILGMIIVGGGIIMVWKIVQNGEIISKELTGTQRQQLEHQLQNGRFLALIPASLDGVPGDDATMWGLLDNTLTTHETFTLTVFVQDAQGFEVAGPSGWSVLYNPTFELDSHAQEEFPIVITPTKEAPAGVYTVVVRATYADAQPYDAQFITVRVR